MDTSEIIKNEKNRLISRINFLGLKTSLVNLAGLSVTREQEEYETLKGLLNHVENIKELEVVTTPNIDGAYTRKKMQWL